MGASDFVCKIIKDPHEVTLGKNEAGWLEFEDSEPRATKDLPDNGNKV